jgi:hypothetical protein
MPHEELAHHRDVFHADIDILEVGIAAAKIILRLTLKAASFRLTLMPFNAL